MNSSKSAIDSRLHLVKANRAAIYAALCRSVSGGHPISDSVVVVAYTSDAGGLGLDASTTTLSVDTTADARQTHEVDEEQSTIVVVSIEAARRLFAQNCPNVANGLDQPPTSGCVRVVAIAGGTPMLVHTDVRPSAPIARG
jgi:hypothetical protein